MKILIVGAGAVGQVYGWHLRAAGHDVTFFVKEKYRAEVAGGLVLHRLGYGRAKRQDWPQVSAVSAVAEVAAQRWDQVWLTLASDALRGELAAQVLGAVGDATVVCLQPDLEDGAYVQEKLASPAQLVQGLITFISYQSPLPGKPGPEGIAYFLPPLAPGLFAGDGTRVQSVVQALRAGGLGAKPVADFAKAAAGAPALLQPLIAALETNAWKLGTLPGSDALALGLSASREALAVAAREAGASTLALRQLLRPLLWRFLLPLSRKLLPLDLETYLHYHFSKVGVQTRLMLDTYIRVGRRHGLPVTSLQQLRAALP
jgi:2-dehydropantoate 2-reductase